MTTERIDIVINEDGSRTVKRNLSDLGDTAESVAGSFDILKDAILGMFAVFSFQKFAAIAGGGRPQFSAQPQVTAQGQPTSAQQPAAAQSDLPPWQRG